MNKIERFRLSLDDEQIIQMPKNFRLLKTSSTGLEINCWAVVDRSNDIQDVKFRLKRTGAKVHGLEGYVDTVFLNDQAYHVFVDVTNFVPDDLNPFLNEVF